MRSRIFALCISTTFLIIVGMPSKAQDLSKYHALFISKFVEQIQWPQGNEKLTVGVMGNSPVNSALASIPKAKQGKLVIKTITNESQVSGCDMLFLPNAQSSKLAGVKQAAQGNNVLIITESDLAKKGAGISFYVEDSKLRFVINKSEMDASGLKVSNTLISMAKVI